MEHRIKRPKIAWCNPILMAVGTTIYANILIISFANGERYDSDECKWRPLAILKVQ